MNLSYIDSDDNNLNTNTFLEDDDDDDDDTLRDIGHDDRHNERLDTMIQI